MTTEHWYIILSYLCVGLIIFCLFSNRLKACAPLHLSAFLFLGILFFWPVLIVEGVLYAKSFSCDAALKRKSGDNSETDAS